MDEPAEYLSKSPSAGRMGKAAEYLVAATCILTTRGELNVSTWECPTNGVSGPTRRAAAKRGRHTPVFVVTHEKRDPCAHLDPGRHTVGLGGTQTGSSLRRSSGIALNHSAGVTGRSGSNP
jgi:hypothetical protein